MPTDTPEVPGELVELIRDLNPTRSTGRTDRPDYRKIEERLKLYVKSHKVTGNREDWNSVTVFVVPSKAFGGKKPTEVVTHLKFVSDGPGHSRDNESGELIYGSAFSQRADWKCQQTGDKYTLIYTQSGGMDI